MPLFADSRGDEKHSVDVRSSWFTEKKTSDGGTQTAEIPTQEGACQSYSRSDAQMQTDPLPEPILPSSEEGVDASLKPSLLAFLHRVESSVAAVLEANTRSHAFHEYAVEWEDQSAEVLCRHSLSHAMVAESLQCTSVAWNASGSVVVAAYGRFDHEDWCPHKSYICTWNLDRRGLNLNKADTSIEFTNCIMSVACHPAIPNILAVGTYNGEVMLVDLSQSEGSEIIASSAFDELSHMEPVLKISWTTKINQHRQRVHQVVSVGGDGKVLVWGLPKKGQRILELQSHFLVSTQDVPKYIRTSRAPISSAMGATAVSFSEIDPDVCIVGTEGGGVLKCSVYTTASVLGPPASPVQMAYQPHYGPVYSASKSPFHQSLFLTCSTDASIRLFHEFQSKPLLTFEPGQGYIFDVAWSPSRPLVFAAASGSGHLLLFDLGSSQSSPVCTLEVGSAKAPVFSMAFNKARPRYLATADASGTIKIWALSDAFVTQEASDKKNLSDLAGKSLD